MSLQDPYTLSFFYNHTVSKVWSAITELNQMKQWYFDNIPEFAPELGFKTSFSVSSGERIFTHQWEVTEVEAQKYIGYSWQFPEYPDGLSHSLFELAQKDGGTELLIHFTIIRPFPNDIPEFKIESGLAGWQYLLGERLTEYLNK